MVLRLPGGVRWADTGSPEATEATLPKGAPSPEGKYQNKLGQSVCIVVMPPTRIPIALEGVGSLILLHTMYNLR